MNKLLTGTLSLALAVIFTGCCGGGGDSGSTDAGLSFTGEMAKGSYDEIKAAQDRGEGADQEIACVFLMSLIEEGAENDADKQLLTDAKELCYGHVHKALYDKTVTEVEARADASLPPFMECIHAKSAVDEEAKEVDVPGLADSKTKAKELCAKAWE